MPFIDATTTEFGQSLPPHGPHTITTHGHGYKTAVAFREGDMSVISRIKSIYPRFSPFGLAAQFLGAVGKKLGLPQGYMSAAYLTPQTWRDELRFATSHHRKEHRITKPEEDLQFRVVEVGGVRLYLVIFHMTKSKGSLFVWQHCGLGFSSRVAEHLLPQIDATLKDLGTFSGADADDIPAPTYLPEGKSHELLRERVAGYMNRATIREYPNAVQPSDVSFYQTGMAAIVRAHQAIIGVRPGTVVVFGSIFHSTWHFLEENQHGFKHWGKADEADLDAFEAYLVNDDEAAGEGGKASKCAYVFVEFPSNPIMVGVDLARLRRLADKHGFYIVTDDTLAGFANLDLLPVADVVMSSLTKAFSGYADVMAGSLVLNPNIDNNGSYRMLKDAVDGQFHNEFFGPDADKLLANSEDYLERSVVLNRNAAGLAEFIYAKSQETVSDNKKYPIRKVLYPPYSQGTSYLSAFLRKPTKELPSPGYGPLFSVEFETMDQTIAFYDNLTFHQGPHLGAHLTLCLTFNALVFGKDPEEAEYHGAYGARQEQVRFSVGLEEDVRDLQGVVQKALDKMVDICGNGSGTKREDVEGTVDGEVLKEEIEREVEMDGEVKTGVNLMA